MAPEKIYLYPSDRAGEDYDVEWAYNPLDDDSIEYTCTDAFIDKACEWLKTHINDYLVKGRDIDYMFDDFRKAMED